MIRIHVIFHLLLTLFIGINASAQSDSYELFYSGSIIYDMVEQDSFIWLSTESKVIGYNRYTRAKTAYQLDGMLAVSDYRSFRFMKDSSGNLWIGGTTGLYRFDGSDWVKHQKFNTNLSVLSADKSGGFWLAKNFDLFHLNGSKTDSFSFKNNFSIVTGEVDRNNDLWINYDSGLLRVSDSKFISPPTITGQLESIQNVATVVVGPDSSLWISGVGGISNNSYPVSFLFKWKNGTWSDPIYTRINEITGVSNICFDPNGVGWASLHNQLVRLGNDTIYPSVTLKNEISVIRTLPDGGLLVGTKRSQGGIPGNGVFEIKNEQVIDSFKVGNGRFNSNIISSIAMDKDSVLWVADRDGYITKYKDGQWETETVKSYASGIPLYIGELLGTSDTMYAVSENGIYSYHNGAEIYNKAEMLGQISATIDHKNNVYFSSVYRNVCMFDQQTVTCNEKPDLGNVNSNYKPLCTDPSGRVWASGSNRLYHTNDTGGWTEVKGHELYNSSMGREMVFDSEKRLWIASHSSYTEYDGKYFIRHRPDQRFIFYTTASVADDNGNVYFGTSNGILRYNGNSWSEYDLSYTGIGSKYVYDIVLKKDGMWVALETGLINLKSLGTWTQLTNAKDTLLSANMPVSTAKIRVYPNPSAGTIHIQHESNTDFTYKITDIKGIAIQEGKMHGEGTIDMTQPGIYLCYIRESNSSVASVVRFVITR